MNSSSRLIVNTGAQYVKTIINILLSLYSTRLVLKLLGIDDFGIYSLVGGVVSMLSFMINSLVASTQRFLSYYQGRNDVNWIKSVFNNCLIVHLVLGLAIVIILELMTPFLFNGFLNITEGREKVASIVYQLVVLILFITLNTSPYRALVVSHENIIYTSVIDVLDGILKVILVIILGYIPFDKLIGYSFVIMCIQLFDFLALVIFCHIKYKECTLPRFKNINKIFIKELFSFASWNLFNSGCVVGRNQGVAIIINRFFGTAMNAAYGLAFSVSGYVNFMSSSMKNAIAPQIMKAEGGGQHDRMLWLCAIESKFAFLLMSAVSIPVMFEMNELLKLWLGNVPRFAALFCDMCLIASLADMLTTGLSTANMAIGKLKDFSLYVYSIKLLTIFAVLIFMWFDRSPIYIAVSYVALELISSLVRLPFMKKQSGLNIPIFIKRVFLKISFPILVLIITCFTVVQLFDFKFRFLLTFTFSFLAYLPSVYFFGLIPDEKVIIENVIKSITYNIKRKFRSSRITKVIITDQE